MNFGNLLILVVSHRRVNQNVPKEEKEAADAVKTIFAQSNVVIAFNYTIAKEEEEEKYIFPLN